MAKFMIWTCGVLLVLVVLKANSLVIKSVNQDGYDFIPNYGTQQFYRKLFSNVRNENHGEMKRAHFWKRNDDFNTINRGDEDERFTVSDSDEIKKRAHFWKRYEHYNSLNKDDENETFMLSNNDDIRKRAHFW
jgi:hypothetical protein